MSLSNQYPTEQEYIYIIRPARRPFNKRFPTIVGIVIGILQMLLNSAIIGLEGGSVAYNPKIDIVYAGFWCSISFFFTWISMFAFLCFRKTLRWGMVVAGMNLASMGFAIILIVFDSIFISTPCVCYLATICDLVSLNNNCTGADGKLRVVKAQLAFTVTMLALNIGYIIIFIAIVILSRRSYKPLYPSFQPISYQYNSSPKVLIRQPIQTSTYSVPHQFNQHELSYSSRHKQPTYPGPRINSRLQMPNFNGLEKY